MRAATQTTAPDSPVREVQAKPTRPMWLLTSCLLQAGIPIKPPVKAAPAVSDSLQCAGLLAHRGNADGEPSGVFALSSIHRTANFHQQARAHSRRYGNLLDVGALCTAWPGVRNRFDKGAQIFGQLFL